MATLRIHLNDKQVYDYDPAELTNQDVKEIERFSGQRFSVFENADMATSDADHMTVLVWLAMRQSGEEPPALEDLAFKFGTTWVEAIDDPTDEPVGGGVDPTTPVPASSEAGKKTGSRTGSAKLSAA